MVALREQEFADHLKNKAARSNGVLLFGNDDAAISTAVRQVVRGVASDEEPLRLDASDLRSDPAKLDDAFRSMSLLGDRRVIVVAGVDETHQGDVLSVIQSAVLGNYVVLISTSLKKTSKLRAAAEASVTFASVAFYEEAGSQLIVRAQTIVGHYGMNMSVEVAERFIDLCGGDRSVLMSEAEKLALYCHGQSAVSIDDVEAVCGSQAEFEADALFSAICEGDVERVDKVYASMVLSGDGKSVLILLQLYLARLESVSAAVSRGADVASACRAAKPPFFDKQQQAIGRYLRFLSGDEMGKMQVAVQAAILQSRQLGDLGNAITGRCLLSLARMCRQLRARAAA